MARVTLFRVPLPFVAAALLPHTPVTDLEVHRQDLVVATQGRSFWVLDDVTPLDELTDAVASAAVHLFEPRDAYRTEFEGPDPDETYLGSELGGASLKAQTVAMNPPYGAMVHYTFAEEPDGEVVLEILDDAGSQVRTFTSEADDVPAEAGMNRFVWDLTYPDVDGEGGGSEAVLGTYRVRLTAEGETQTRSFDVLKDPRNSAAVADLQAQFDLLVNIRDRQQELADAIDAIEDVREQTTGLLERAVGARGEEGGALATSAESLLDALRKIEARLVREPEGRKMGYTVPMLRSQLGQLSGLVDNADARPTEPQMARYEELAVRLAEQLRALDAVWDGELAAFNRAVREEGIPPVIVPGR